MSEILIGDKRNQTALLRGSLATAAPALAALVTVFSTSAVTLLEVFGLGRWGMAASGVLVLCLSHLLWRGRWWAGLPTLLMALAAGVMFAVKFIRPLSAYMAANPTEGLGDLWQPLMMLSPSLVLVVICLGLVLLVLKGMAAAARSRHHRVSRLAWGLVVIWLLVLAGDWAYQSWAWRSWPEASDLVVRLCSRQSQVNQEAQKLLAQMGPEAAPALLEALGTTDPELECLREGAAKVLAGMGPVMRPALIQAAGACHQGALQVLVEIGDAKAARPLLDIYRRPNLKCPPEYSKKLAQAIGKLDPTLKLE